MANGRRNQDSSRRPNRTIGSIVIRQLRHLHHGNGPQAVHVATELEATCAVHVGVRTGITIAEGVHCDLTAWAWLHNLDGWRRYK